MKSEHVSHSKSSKSFCLRLAATSPGRGDFEWCLPQDPCSQAPAGPRCLPCICLRGTEQGEHKVVWLQNFPYHPEPQPPCFRIEVQSPVSTPKDDLVVITCKFEEGPGIPLLLCCHLGLLWVKDCITPPHISDSPSVKFEGSGQPSQSMWGIAGRFNMK